MVNENDYYTEAMNDLNRYVELMFLWTDVEAAWEFDKEFSLKFEAWLGKKAQETAEDLMELNP